MIGLNPKCCLALKTDSAHPLNSRQYMGHSRHSHIHEFKGTTLQCKPFRGYPVLYSHGFRIQNAQNSGRQGEERGREGEEREREGRRGGGRGEEGRRQGEERGRKDEMGHSTVRVFSLNTQLLPTPGLATPAPGHTTDKVSEALFNH